MCNKNIICGSSTCIESYERSIASFPNIDKYWLPEKNNNANILSISKKTDKRICWFRCKKCSHEYDTSPRTFVNNIGCRYCTSFGPIVCNNIDCSICVPERLISVIDIQLYWNNENTVDPILIRKGCSKKNYLFNCRRCTHKYETSPVVFLRSYGCRYCSHNSLLLCEDMNCIKCRDNSFRASPMYKYVIPEDIERISRLHIKSGERCTFLCPYCNHEYISTLMDVSRGSWCSCRRNKTELLVYSWLSETYSQYNIEKQYRLSSDRSKRFDIVMQDIRISG